MEPLRVLDVMIQNGRCLLMALWRGFGQDSREKIDIIINFRNDRNNHMRNTAIVLGTTSNQQIHIRVLQTRCTRDQRSLVKTLLITWISSETIHGKVPKQKLRND